MQHADETALPNTAKQAKVSASGMSYKGRVKNGVVVLPPEAKLAEGTEVEVTPTEVEATDPFLKAIRKVAKPRPHWPKDFALNHGHYLRGEPRKS